MTQLMRENLLPLFREMNDAHAGLLVQRGLMNWSSEDKEKKDKRELLKKISSVKPPSVYHLALKRWIHKTYGSDEDSTFANVAAKVEGRLMTGLPLGGALETGVTTHHSYGMPVLPGSSIKGAVRNYAEYLYCEKDADGKPVFEGKKLNRKLKVPERFHKSLEALFGTDEEAETQDAGYIVWHDALWLPPINKDGNFGEGSDAKPFLEDIITVHHQAYYNANKAKATGMEAPIPNQQLAVQGAFYFVLEGAPQWVAYAKKLLMEAIQYNGLGAKTSSGYGYFVLDDGLDKKLKALVSGQVLAAALSQNSDDPYQIVRIKLQSMNEKQLADSLGAGNTKFFASCELDKNNEEHSRGVVGVAMELYRNLLEGWAEADKKTGAGKAYKFISKYL